MNRLKEVEVDKTNRPSHYTQHHVECQDFRRGLPAPLSDAAKHRWRRGSKETPWEDHSSMQWFVRDFISHIEEYEPLPTGKAARMALQILLCGTTMSDSCAQDLLAIIDLATQRDMEPAITRLLHKAPSIKVAA